MAGGVRGVPLLDPTLNRAFAELVLVARADRGVGRRPHSDRQVLAFAVAAQQYATARAWPEAVAALVELAQLDARGDDASVEETALRLRVLACARALDGAVRVGRIELDGQATSVMTAVTTPLRRPLEIVSGE